VLVSEWAVAPTVPEVRGLFVAVAEAEAAEAEAVEAEAVEGFNLVAPTAVTHGEEAGHEGYSRTGEGAGGGEVWEVQPGQGVLPDTDLNTRQ
jgi:hypothetical protein